jgi:ethanolamine utilization microcompartment shell protein EutS
VIRNPAKQVRLWRLLQHPQTELIALDGTHAQAVGVLLSQSPTADIVDAHVVICARQSGYAILTSDPVDLPRLDPTLQIVTV